MYKRQALSQAAWQLALLRGLTGLGIGGILASSNVIASEYASRRWRGLAVSLQSTGYALGATLGGLLAVWLIGAWGWRSVFVFGAGLTLAVIPLVCLCLPESLDFLLARRPPRALQRVNALARRLGRAALAELPSPPGGGAEHGSRLARLLCVAQRRTTLLLWALFFLVMFEMCIRDSDMGMVMNISDHIIVLDHGDVIARGNPEQIRHDEKVIAAYLGADEEELS